MLAPISRALLGGDFLVEKDLLCDNKRKRVVPAAHFYSKLPTHQLQTKFPPSPEESSRLCLNQTSQSKKAPKTDFLEIVKEFPSITQPNFNRQETEHGVELYIETTGPPVAFKARKLDSAKYRDAKQEFEKLIEMGVLEPSDSNWASCLHMVRKKNGDWRPCGDYRLLNTRTKSDNYPIPNLHDFAGQLKDCTIFSTLDIRMGYHNIPIKKEDRHKTALITPFGLFQYKRMPFGLKISAATFQRLMDKAFRGLWFAFVFVDDVLIGSKNPSEHKEHLRSALRRIKEYGLCLNIDKCVFGVSEIEFLGHLVTPRGISPSPKKVEAIVEFPRPTTIKQMQEYLGMLNFYRKFLPNIANTLRPLHDFLTLSFETHGLKPNTKTKKPLAEWSNEASEAFEKSKNILASATLLNFPVDSWQLSLTCDASNTAYGSVLEQYNPIRKCTEPLSFYSKKFSKAEEEYSTFDRELTAIFNSVRHFRHYLEGRKFVIWTDHKPILFSLHKRADPWSTRQRRQLLEISEYAAEIRHISGKSNLVSDALSRNPINLLSICSITKEISIESISDHQLDDSVLQDFISNKRHTGLTLESVDIPESKKRVICDFTAGRQRPYVPKALQRQIFDKFHGLSHAGTSVTTQLINDRYVWFNMKSDVRNWVRNCVECQSSKVQRHTKPPVEIIPMPTRRFRQVMIDIVGPLPKSNHHRYLLTIIDRFTRWPEVVALPSIEADTVATAFVENWVSRFGVPDELASDRGSQFTSNLWNSMLRLYGISKRQSTSYHPQAQGLVERFHRSLKNALKTKCKNANDWFFELPFVMLGLRTAPKEALGVSPAEMVYGEPISIPGEMISAPVDSSSIEMVKALRKVVGKLVPKTMVKLKPFVPYVPKELYSSKFVFVRRDGAKVPIQKPYDGPYQVLETADKTFKLQLGDKTDWVSIERLKPAHIDMDEPVKLALPPRRGRPRKITSEMNGD